MSTKRFLLDDAGELIDITNHQFIEYGEEVCELLNQLNDENEELKHQLITLDGLYCSDKEDMSEVFQLNLQKFL